MSYKEKHKYTPRRSTMTSVETVEGETIEQKVFRLVQNKEPIKDGAPEIFTEKALGVQSAYNIRTDRWELATEAMDKIIASKTAETTTNPKVIDMKPTGTQDGGAESTDGKVT